MCVGVAVRKAGRRGVIAIGEFAMSTLHALSAFTVQGKSNKIEYGLFQSCGPISLMWELRGRPRQEQEGCSKT